MKDTNSSYVCVLGEVVLQLLMVTIAEMPERTETAVVLYVLTKIRAIMQARRETICQLDTMWDSQKAMQLYM